MPWHNRPPAPFAPRTFCPNLPIGPKIFGIPIAQKKYAQNAEIPVGVLIGFVVSSVHFDNAEMAAGFWPAAHGDRAAARPRGRLPRGSGPEAQRVVERLTGFDPEGSPAWRQIVEQFTIGVTHAELKSVAQVICSITRLKLDRDATRDNRVLVKWFDENWDAIRPHITSLHLRDDTATIIGNPPCVD
jgi:hypothetical protein